MHTSKKLFLSIHIYFYSLYKENFNSYENFAWTIKGVNNVWGKWLLHQSKRNMLEINNILLAIPSHFSSCHELTTM